MLQVEGQGLPSAPGVRLHTAAAPLTFDLHGDGELTGCEDVQRVLLAQVSQAAPATLLKE